MRIFIFALTLVLINACSSTPKPKYLVYISDGYVQCEQPPLPLRETREHLTNAGIKVWSSHCAQISNLSVIAMCGASGAGIHLHEIDSQQVDNAQRLGFKPVSYLSQRSLNYQTIACGL